MSLTGHEPSLADEIQGIFQLVKVSVPFRRVGIVGQKDVRHGRSIQPVEGEGGKSVETAPSVAKPLEMAQCLGQNLSDRLL